MRDLFRLPYLLLALLLALPAVQSGGHPAGTAPVMAIHDMAMHDMAMHDMARHDMTGHDMAGHDMTGHDMAGHHQAPAHAPATHHDCIGCIAPLDIAVYRPARAPRLLPGLAHGPANAAFVLSGALAPEPRPPRNLI